VDLPEAMKKFLHIIAALSSAHMIPLETNDLDVRASA
jgi:hypothetical protein